MRNTEKAMEQAAMNIETTTEERVTEAVRNSKKEKVSSELSEAISTATGKKVKVDEDTLLNNMILKRSARTLKMCRVAMRKWVGIDYKEVYITSLVPENRLFRFLGLTETIVDKEFKDVELTDGTIVDLATGAKYYEINVPLIYADYVSEPTSAKAVSQRRAHDKSVANIMNGIDKNDILFEYVESSSAQQRTLKGVHIPANFKYSEEYLTKFDTTIPGCAEYVEFLKTLTGAEAIYEAMTYGGYSAEFRYDDDTQTHLASPAKFGARVGACQTSTLSLGNKFRVHHIGTVNVKWEAAEAPLREYFSKIYSGARLEKVLNTYHDAWKEEKLDGQSMVRVSAVKKALRRVGIKVTIEELTGKLMQLRWAGVKGTAFIVPDKVLDACALTLDDGTTVYPYREFDMIVEDSSWKYSPRTNFYTNDLAPELELVQLSKSKHSNSINYQFAQSLDGDFNKDIKMKDLFRDLIDRMYERIWNAMNDSEMAKDLLGMSSLDENSSMLDIDSYKMTLKSKASAALDAHDEIVNDPWWRQKIMTLFGKTKDNSSYGKILVQGANRFVISDPVAMFRTDLAKNIKVNDDGSYTFDIEITRMSQLAIRNVIGVYWNDNNGKAVLFRSPCVHPGEPQLVDIISLDDIPEEIPTAYGSIPARELFASTTELCVVNCFNMVLDCLGGADTDGDTVLIVTEPSIVKMRSISRESLLTSTGGKQYKVKLCSAEMKKYMASSLRDSGIGKITNNATTWRDIESMLIHMQKDKNNKYHLPENVKEDLEDKKRAAEEALRTRGAADCKDAMDEYERQAVMEIASMHDINNDALLKEWMLSVIKACEAALRICRRLQEIAIETAKSGVWIEFEKYEYIKLTVRASWHRKVKEEKSFNSWSVMGFLDSYSKEKWEELREKAITTSKALNFGIENSDLVNYANVDKLIKRIKADYGKDIKALDDKCRDYMIRYGKSDALDERRKQAYNDINANYHTELKRISIQYNIPVDTMSALVYNATVDGDKNNRTGVSFAWMVWSDELIHTLKHLNSGRSTTRLVAISMAKEYETYSLESGKYDVVDGKVTPEVFPDTVVGYASVPDGLYDLENYDGKSYLLLEKEKPQIEEMNLNIAGLDLKLIGFLHFEYKGHQMTRDIVKNLLASPIANGIIAIRSMESGKVLKAADGSEQKLVAAMVYVRTEEGKPWTCIGNIPNNGSKKEQNKFLSQVLHDKIVKVEVAKGADSMDKLKTSDKEPSRLSLKLVSVLKDLNK